MNIAKKLFLFLFLFAGLILFFGFPLITLAQADQFGINTLANTELPRADIRDTIANIIKIALGFLGIVVVVLIMYGGFMYMTAGGDSEKIDKGKKILINSVIGLVIIMSAYGITDYIFRALPQAANYVPSPGDSEDQGFEPGFDDPTVGSDFTVKDITPQGDVKSKNVAVRVVFSYNVKPKTVLNNILVRNLDKEQEPIVNGTYHVKGNVVEFRPDTLCKEVSDQYCFEDQTSYRIKVKNGSTGVRSSTKYYDEYISGSREMLKQEIVSSEDNYIEDGYMEEGNTDSWLSTKGEIEKDSQEVWQGAQSLKIISVDESGADVYQAIDDLSSDDIYSIEFWYKTEQPLNVKISQESINDDDQNTYTDQSLIYDNEWNKFEYRGRLQPGKTSLSVGVYSNSENTIVYLDGVVVQKVGEVGISPKTIDEKMLACRVFGKDNNCEAVFRTGVLIDNLPPQTTIFGLDPSYGNSVPRVPDPEYNNYDENIPVNANQPQAVAVSCNILDSAVSENDFKGGVSKATLLVKQDSPNQTGYEKMDEFVPASQVNQPKINNALLQWETGSLQYNSIHNIKVQSVDIAANSKDSNILEVIVRPWHCFDGILQTQLGEKDPPGAGPPECGGACGACEQDSCETDFDCANGACINGVCLSLPKIDSINPDNGAFGNFVTIIGSGFGSKQGNGNVYFTDSKGVMNIVSQELPLHCQSVWRDDKIVVSVPTGARTGPIKIVTNQELYDTTADKRGWIGDFTVNDIFRPGLCSVVPNEAKPLSEVELLGYNFGTLPKTGEDKFVRISDTETSFGNWTDTIIDNVSVPALPKQNTSIYVHALGQDSNILPFSVLASDDLPIIGYVNPAFGPALQYITIFGSNFGSVAGVVKFLGSDGSETLALVDFPKECEKAYWNDKYVVVKVPKVDIFEASGLGVTEKEIKYKLKLFTAEGVESINTVDFDVNNKDINPGICAIKPDNGLPGRVYPEIFGERFKDEENYGKVEFFDGQQVTDFSLEAKDPQHLWSNQLIRTSIPSEAKTGEMLIYDNEGKKSNKIYFNIMSCNDNSDCPGEKICCENGSCQMECDNPLPYGSYKWKFSTGAGGENFFCEDDEDCVCPDNPTPENPCYRCNPETGKCEAVCEDDDDCPLGQYCWCPEKQEAIKPFCICKDILPEVVEDEGCLENIQSPTPFKNSLDACSNAKIGARFTLDMDPRSFTPLAIKLQKCNKGSKFSSVDCEQISWEKQNLEFLYSKENVGKVNGFLINSINELDTGYWYKVGIMGNDVGAENPKVLTFPNQNGQQLSLNNSYFWHFKVKGYCEPENVMVVPNEFTFHQKTSSHVFTAEALAGNCNVITVQGWKWEVLDNEAQFIDLKDVYNKENKLIENKKRVFPLNNTPVQFIDNEPVFQTVKLNAKYLNLSGTSNIIVDLMENKDNPQVLIQIDCVNSTQSPTPFMNDQNVCINAAISARFTRDMDDTRLLDSQYINVRKCNKCKNQRCEFLNESCDEIINSRSVEKIGNDNKPGEGFLFIPNKSVLNSNTWYKVTIIGGDQGMRSAGDNKAMVDDFIWTFKTRESEELCQISKALITPSRALAEQKDEQKKFFGTPIGPECSILYDSYQWKWYKDPLDDNRAALLSDPFSSVIYGAEMLKSSDMNPQAFQDWRRVSTDDNNTTLAIVDTPNQPRQYSFKIVKPSKVQDNGIEQSVVLQSGAKYELFVDYNLKQNKQLSINLYGDNGSIIPMITLDPDLNTYTQEFIMPNNETDVDVRIIGYEQQDVDALIHKVSIKQLISGKGEVTAVAVNQTGYDNPVNIIGEIIEYNVKGRAQFTIIFKTPIVSQYWPDCNTACLNASVGGQFSVKMDTDTIDETRFLLYECNEQECNELRQKEILVTYSNSETPDGKGTKFYLSPYINQSSLNANSWYRVVVRGTSTGVKSKQGVSLDELNYDSDNDTILDAFSWVFKTSDRKCEIDKINVIPTQKLAKRINLKIDYESEALGAPDECNPNGQKIDKLTIDWNWFSENKEQTIKDVVSITNSRENILPLDFGDPFQVATTLSEGKADIITHDKFETARGYGGLEVICGYNNDLECAQQNPPLGVNEIGVSDLDKCCYTRPKVVVKTGDKSKVNNSYAVYEDSDNNLYPQPGINQGLDNITEGVCRNAVFTIEFTDLMNVSSLKNNFILQYRRKGTDPVCKSDGIENSWCDIENELSFVNTADRTIMHIYPNNLLFPERKYQIKFNGGSLDSEGINYEGGVKSISNISMAGDLKWTFWVKDEICKVSSVDILVARKNNIDSNKNNFIDKNIINCGLRNDCKDDLIGSLENNQHMYVPYAFDKDKQLVRANYSWSQSNYDILRICSLDSNMACENVLKRTKEELGGDKLVNGTNVVEPLKDGNSIVTVYCEGAYPDSGYGTSSVKTQVFLCNNPWPGLDSFPWRDTDEFYANSTNMSFYYCRDKGAEGPDDDLSRLKNPVVFNPSVIIDPNCPNETDFVCDNSGNRYNNPCSAKQNGLSENDYYSCPSFTETIVTHPNCSGVADYVCGEDGRTYNNECAAKQQEPEVYIIKKGRCKDLLIKELLFFVE
jgi:hypothetical protein